jgi:predicted Rdx family selenoprotein
VQPALVAGSNGVFDVFRDGALIFSKDRAGRFPEVAEIVAALRDS